MSLTYTYLFLLIWIAYLICSGVFLFSRGFLLSRISKAEISSCRHLSNDINEEYYLNNEIVSEIFKNVNASSSLCLPKKSKVIILVIDALKYDFGVYKSNLENPLPYENKLPIINEMLLTEPKKSRIFKFIADPPTTTLQRLKGLTTGSLPTFIDVGSNFASPEINEDNIIDQIVNNGQTAVFLGDSTWTDLYPKRFKRQYSYPSFDIFDLDTVDTEIQKYLPLEMQTTDWDLLIAHFLGVDHCGHRYGPLHNEMARKLTEMNEMIRTVIENMDNETTLYVMGDHGMTITGDHGGESNDEINALLFAYSKSHNFITSDFGSDNTTLRQIDIVPTLAAIFGVPIPYSNLGLMNFNILPDVPVSHMVKHQILQLHAWQNAKQIYNYFHNYALENSRTFIFEEMDDLANQFIILTHRVNTIYNEEAFKNFILDLNQQLRDILDICRNIWVKFDANQMSQGLLLTFLPIFFSFLLIHNLRTAQFPRIFTSTIISYIYLFNFAAGVFGYRYFKDLSMKTEEHGVIFTTGIISTLFFTFLTLQNWPDIATNWSLTKRFHNLGTRCIFFITITVYFSNSFIIQEPKILSYLITALILILMYDILKAQIRIDSSSTKSAKLKLKSLLKSTAFKLIIFGCVAICLIRLSHILFRCREEQGNCDFQTSITTNTTINNVNGKSSASTGKMNSNSKNYVFSVASLIIFTALTRLYLRSCGNLTGYSPNVLFARFGPTVATFCTSFHILLSSAPIKTIKLSQLDASAWVVYGVLIIQIIIVLICPLMTYVLPPKPILTLNPYGNVVPELFKKIKKLYDGGESIERRTEIPVVYGLATIYSSTVLSFGVILAQTLVLLLDVNSSFGILICIGVSSILLILHSILRYQTSYSLESCMQPNFTATVAWFLLAHYSFFATSHQTTLSQIDWRAAFIGRSAKFNNSNILSAILVLCNTFSGQIFFMSMYSLLCSETFSIYALFPHLKPIVIPTTTISTTGPAQKDKKSTNQKSNYSNYRATTVNKSENETNSRAYYSNEFDVTRGELILFENEPVYFGCLFKLAIQFYMLQGIKIFCAMMACTIHCRHLMVWKIFAPRFIYEGLSTFVAMPAIILGYLLVVRIHWSVNRLINQINKRK